MTHNLKPDVAKKLCELLPTLQQTTGYLRRGDCFCVEGALLARQPIRWTWDHSPAERLPVGHRGWECPDDRRRFLRHPQRPGMDLRGLRARAVGWWIVKPHHLSTAALWVAVSAGPWFPDHVRLFILGVAFGLLFLSVVLGWSQRNERRRGA